jgi:hypothetical protein
VYQDIAQGGKKKARLSMQLALDEASEELGYGNLRILLSPDTASKIDGLLWKSSRTDLGVGINPCTFNDGDPDSVQLSTDIIRQYDMLNAGAAAPSLSDLQSIIGKSKVTLARSFVELDASLKMFHIYLHTFYGPVHQVTTSWRDFVARAINEYRTLEHYQALTAGHRLLVPALVQHWCKLKFGYFVDQQWNSATAVTAPDFEALWMKIATGEQWESPLPALHLSPSPQVGAPTPGGLGAPLVPGAPGNIPVNVPGNVPGNADTPASSAVINLQYNATKFAGFKALGLMIRDVISRAAAAGKPLPKNDRGLDMCITFHVKGFCNANCKRRADHSPPGPVRNPAEETRLHAWCETCYVAAT